VRTGPTEQLEELGDLGHVLLGDLLLEHGGRRRGRAGKGAEHVVDAHAAVARRVHRCVADEGELEVAHRRLGDDVEAPEGEEQVGLDPLAQGGVGEDEAGVGHIEVALGADDGQLAALARRRVERRDDEGRGLGGVVGGGAHGGVGGGGHGHTHPFGFGRPET
jgi:hypothetical protein